MNKFYPFCNIRILGKFSIILKIFFKIFKVPIVKVYCVSFGNKKFVISLKCSTDVTNKPEVRNVSKSHNFTHPNGIILFHFPS